MRFTRSVRGGTLAGTVLLAVVSITAIGNSSATATNGTSAPRGNVTVSPAAPAAPAAPASMPEQLDGIVAAVADLVDAHPDLFAGLDYDAATGKVRVAAPATNFTAIWELKGSNALNDSRVEVVAARYSTSGASSAFQKYLSTSALAPKIVNWSVLPDGSGVSIGVQQDLTDADMSDLASFPGQVSVTIGVTKGSLADAQSDANPFSGGARYFAGKLTPPAANPTLDHGCTAGFPYVISGTKYLLTAGHCFQQNAGNDQAYRVSGSNSNPTPLSLMAVFYGKTTWNGQNGTFQTGSDNANHGDLSLINVSAAGNGITDQIWSGNTSLKYVVSRTAPAVGQSICRFGTTSGSQLCGFSASAVNATHTYDDGTVLRQGDYAYLAGDPNQCARPGDSGGPVYKQDGSGNAIAVGIISGESTAANGCYLYFTGMEEAIQAWGGGPNLH